MKRRLFLISAAVLLTSACVQNNSNLTSRPEVAIDSKAYQVITVIQLKSMLENKDFLLVNVHTPYVGEIHGTDFFIPYNEIEQNLSKLPGHKNAAIVLYCQSGGMSGSAAKVLIRMGYTNVREVDGGMAAWEQQGYPLIQAPE